ncbi:MAG: IS1595 family transposase [Oricola sp.]|nr:MAG: IS1595 family transposase [Oricola sp.]
MTMQFNSLFEMMEAFPDEQAAIDHLRCIRWGENDERAHCPHCGSTKVYNFSDKRNHKCGDCKKRFSIKVGTIFEDSKIPLRKWFMAIWLITSHKKGVASTTLARDIKVTQKTAWFMLHRLRHAARTQSFNRPLEGTVEVDETFMGGKDKNKHADKRSGKRGPSGKAVVWGALERDGELRTFHLTSLKQVKDAVRAQVKAGDLVISDDYPGYAGLSDTHWHETVNHSAGEYARHGNFFHINSIEGAWSHIKRQVYGIHHWISHKHLGRYLSEMTWRYNRREMEEGDRLNALLGCVDGRLRYKELIA